MNLSRRGLSTGAKAGAVVILIVIVLGAVYLIPSLTKGGGTQSAPSGSGPAPITGLPSLFTDFRQMQMSFNTYDAMNDFVQNQSLSYTVLGTGKINSTQFTRVEFATAGVPNDVVGWFNSTGGIARADVLGERNYTGNGVANLPFVQTYFNDFGYIVSLANNATLISLLSKTSEATTSFGPTQMDVTTYLLESRFAPYTKMTLQIATIPGTNAQVAVYVNAKESDGSTILLQVTSLTR
jgi:hypothetical protein